MAPHNFYDSAFGFAKSALEATDHILTQAEKHIPDVSKIINVRLYEDMNPFSFQVVGVIHLSRKILWRLNGDPDSDPDLEVKTYEDMHALLRSTLKQYEGSEKNKEEVNKKAELSEITKMSGPLPPLDITGKGFAEGMALPNIFFHCSMVYAILRKEGVPLGKADYLYPFLKQFNVVPKDAPHLPAA